MPVVEQSSLEVSQSNTDSSNIDEGYEDQSGTSVQRPSSQTRPKTVYTPDNIDSRQRRSTTTLTTHMTTPQPVPVRVTNRKQSKPRQHVRKHIHSP